MTFKEAVEIARSIPSYGVWLDMSPLDKYEEALHTLISALDDNFPDVVSSLTEVKSLSK